MALQSVPSVGVKTVQRHQSPTPPVSINKKPPYSCWNCGSCHFVRYCSFKLHRCREFNRLGHKEGFYIPPGQKPTPNRGQPPNKHNQRRKTRTNFSPQSNRIYVTIQLNGLAIRRQMVPALDITLILQKLWKTIGQTHTTKTFSTECIRGLCPHHWRVTIHHHV